MVTELNAKAVEQVNVGRLRVHVHIVAELRQDQTRRLDALASDEHSLVSVAVLIEPKAASSQAIRHPLETRDTGLSPDLRKLSHTAAGVSVGI